MSEEVNTNLAVTTGVTEPSPAAPTNNNVTEGTDDKSQQQVQMQPQAQVQQQAQVNKKVAKKPAEVKNDDRFSGAGVVSNAKLIGLSDVPDARGDRMCQDTITRQKVAVKASGQHKQRIIVNVSEEGIKLIDLRTATILHHHPVHKISFISRDITDRRAFGYIYGPGDRTHKFIGIKTEKAAENLVLTLRDLFQVVYEKKKKQMETAKEQKVEEAKKQEEEDSKVVKLGDELTTESSTDDEPVYSVPKNNNAVTEPKKEDDLSKLQNELVNIEENIKDMDKMESLFDDLPSQAAPAAAPASDPWGAPAESTPQQSNGTSASSDLKDLFGSEPVAAINKQDILSRYGTPAGPQPGFGAPQPGAFGAPQPGAFGAFPAQPGTPFPMAQPGFPVAQNPAVNPFARPPMATGFVAPPPPVPQRQPPAAGFPLAVNPFGAPQPAPFAGTNFFEPAPAPQQTTSIFDEPVLAPVKLEDKSAQPPPVTQQSKDAFADLCDIGGKDKVAKTPKDLFADLTSQPKKSMNELIVEKTAGVQLNPAQASDPFGSVDNPALPDAVNFSLPFPCKSSDPFDTSYLHSQKTQSALPAKPHTATLPQDMLNPSSNKNTHAWETNVTTHNSGNFSDGDDLFDLPSPDGPPPPLPSGLPPPLPIEHVTIGDRSSPVPPIPPPRPNSASSTTGSTNSPLLPPRNTDHVPSDRQSPLQSPSTNSQNSLPSSHVPRPRPRANVSSEPPKLPPRNNLQFEQFSLSKHPPDNGRVTENSVTNQKPELSDTQTKGFTIEDPFLSSDPFADIDPFVSSDGFSVSSSFDNLNSSDPFMSFSSHRSDRPPDNAQNGESSCNSTDDPFAVFDKSLGDSFNFKSGSLKKSGKRKSSGGKHAPVSDPADPFGVLLASKPIQPDPLYATVNKPPM